MNMTWPAARLPGRLLCGIIASMCVAPVDVSAQQLFRSPTDAANALVAALRDGKPPQLYLIFGVSGRDVLSSGDAVSDNTNRRRFLAAYDTRHSIVETGRTATLLVGEEAFPFPIPIFETREGWKFFIEAGRRELLARRIGRNELAAIQASLAFVDAQQEYAAKDWAGQGVGVYAQRIVSRAGSKDGLYWDSAAGEEQSPLGELAAEAAAEGYKAGEARRPFHGYYYKILRRQGDSAPGGAIDYVVAGKMIGGFALLAYPAEYGRSGVKSFMLNHEGTVYQKDLGSSTGRTAARIQSFNPEKGWEKIAPEKQ